MYSGCRYSEQISFYFKHALQEIHATTLLSSRPPAQPICYLISQICLSKLAKPSQSLAYCDVVIAKPWDCSFGMVNLRQLLGAIDPSSFFGALAALTVGICH